MIPSDRILRRVWGKRANPNRTPRNTKGTAMKRPSAATSLALLFTTVFVLGIGSGAQAEESRSVKMKFSGTNVATTHNLRPNTITDETHFTGNGSLGHVPVPEPHTDGRS